MWLLKGSESASDSSENDLAGKEAVSANDDMKEQFEQQQVLLQQLKDLVRKNEQELLKKEQDLEESASKLSKIKLQHKAKIAQLNNKLVEVQKKMSGSVTEKNPEDGQANETLSVDTSRGKVLMLKKQLEESRAIFEKRQKEMADKKNSVEEILASLTIQLEEKDKIIAELKSSNPNIGVSSTTSIKQEDTGLQEMYAQIVYKDSKIMDLDSRILQLERQVMDLQENVKEKEEVIQTRNKAIQLMTDDLNRRGKVVVDQLDDTRDQMRLMQENFATLEANWKEKESRLVGELDEAKIKFDRELSEKANDISVLKTSLSKLENVRFELVSRNAQLQEKVVRLQESLNEKASKTSVDESTSCLQPEMDLLKEELKKKDLIISDLQQSVGGTSKSSNQKLIKMKAQHKSQVRALELQIKELKTAIDTGDQATELQNRIADLEEEKGNLQLRLVDFEENLVTCDQQQKQILELKEKLMQQSADLDEHVKMISMVQGKHLDMIEQLAEKNRYIEDLEVSHHEANSQLQYEREIKTHLEMELSNTKTSHEALRVSFEEQLSVVKTTKSDNEKMDTALLDIEKEKSSLEAVNEELRATISELRSNLSIALDESDGRNEGLQSKNELIEKLQEEMLVASRELQKEIDDLKIEKDNSNLLIQKKDAFISQQNDKIDELSAMTSQLNSELHSKTEETKLLSETISQLTHELNVNMNSHSMEGRKANDKITSLIEQLVETEAEVNRLQTLCTEYDVRLQDTISARDDALGELSRCNQIAIDKQNEHSNLEHQNAALVKERDDHQRTIQENIRLIEELHKKLQQLEDNLSDNLNNMTGLEENLRQATERVRDEVTHKESFESQVKQLEMGMKMKQEELEIMQGQLQDKEEQCLMFQMELQNTCDKANDLQNIIGTLTDKCTTLKEDVVLSNQGQQILEQTIIELQNELKNSKDEIAALQNEMEGLRNCLNDASSALNEEIEAKQNLERKYEASEKLHESVLEGKLEEIKHLTLKLEHMQTEGGTQDAWVKTLELDLLNLKSEFQNSNQLIEELKAQISSHTISEDKLLLDNTTLRDKCEKLEIEYADNVHALEMVTQELKVTRTDLENVSLCLQTVNSELEIRSSTVSALQVELKDAKSELDAITTEKEAVEAQNTNLTEKLTAMEQKFEELLQRLEKLNSLETEFTLLQEQFENCNKNHEADAVQMKSEIADLSTSLQNKEFELGEQFKALQISHEQVEVAIKEREDLKKSEERLRVFEEEFYKQAESIGILESEVKQLSEEGSRLRDQSARLMEYIQQLETDLACTSEAAKEIESAQNIFCAGFYERLEKLQQAVHKGGASEIDNKKRGSDFDEQDILRERSNLNNLLEEFDILHLNVCIAFNSLDNQIILGNEKAEKFCSELSVAQERYAQAVAENQELEAQLLELSDFKNQVQTLTEEISEVEQKLAALNTVNQSLEETLLRQNEEKLGINEDNLKLKQEMDVLLTKMHQRETFVTNIQSQVQQLTDHMQSLQCNASEQVQSLSGKLESANKEVQTLQDDNQSLQTKLQQQDLVMRELESSLEDIKTNYDNSQMQNKELEMQLHQSVEQADISKKEAQSSKLEIEALTEQIRHLKSQFEDSEIHFKANADLIQDQASKIQTLQQCLDAKDQDVETLSIYKQENETLQGRIEDLANNLEIAHEKIAKFEILVSSIKQDILLEKEKNERLEKELEKMLKAAQLNERIQHTEEEWQAQVSDFEVKNQELQSRIIILSHNLEEAEVIKCQLQADLEAKDKLCVDQQLWLEQTKAEMENALEKLKIFSDIISQLKDGVTFSDNNMAECKKILEGHDVQPENELSNTEALALSFDYSCAILTKVRETMQENNEELNARESDILLLQESLQLSKAKFSDLESANERLREEVDQLKEQHLFLQTQLSQSFETDTTVDMLKSQLENFSIEKKAMQDSFKEQEDVIGALLDQRRHLEERLNEVQNKLARDAMELERMAAENNRMEEKLINESNARTALQQEINYFNEQLQSFNDLKSKVKELENVNHILDEEKALLEDKLNNLSSQDNESKSSLQVEVERLKKEVSALMEAKGLLEDQLQTSIEEISKLNEEKCEYERLASESAAEHHRIEDLKSEHEQLKLDNKELIDKLQALQRMGSQVNDSEDMEDRENSIVEKHQVVLPSVAVDHLQGTSPTEQPTPNNNQASPAPETLSEHKQLKTQLAVLQIKNEKMLSKLKLFKDKNDKLQLQINNLLTTQGQLEDEKLRLGHYNDHAKDEIGRLSSELRNVERLWKSEVKMLQDRLDTVEVANGKIVEIKEDIERKLMKQIDRSEIIMNEKVAVENSLSEALAKLQLQESAHKDEVDQLTLQLSQLRRQLDSFQEHDAFLESDNAEFQHLIENLRTEKTKSDQEIKVQSEKYVLLVQEHNKLKTELEDLRSQLEDVGDVSSLKKSYTSLQKEYKELINVKLHLESEAEYLKGELNATSDDKASLEKELHSAKSMLLAVPALRETLSGMKTESQDAEHSDLCEAIQQLTKDLVDTKFENDEFKNKAQNDVQMEETVSTVKIQNAELLERISRLEGDIWKLEDEKQQLVDLRHSSDQKSLTKALADIDKLQAENSKLIEELDNQDVDLKHLETEKDQIEAEARLTFQQQQETIKDLRSQLLQREEEQICQDDKRDSTDLQNLNIEIPYLKEQLKEKVLMLECETEKSSSLEAENNELRNKIEKLHSDLRHLDDEKHTLSIELANLKSESMSAKQQLDNWKIQFAAIEEKQVISTEALQRVSLSASENNIPEESNLLKAEIETLSSELKHTVHSLHTRDLRCEQLTSEIVQLIEERDSLQMRLSSLLRADQQKEMKMKLLEKQLLTTQNNPSAFSDREINNSSHQELGNLKVSPESLNKKLQESEEQRKELQQINAVLDQALAAEREHRIKMSADLKFANEELAGLGRRQKLKGETILSVEEDYDGQVPLLPEHSQTLAFLYEDVLANHQLDTRKKVGIVDRI